ncbi:Protein kinase domain/Protein tyrosine kinase/Fungal protein kinase, putative [Angomonas deanei]|uniref:Protein kinase domain/Protein tyrosine kinase/Fungal protein kinase, putative n=1 Tax=Angomonas deanei TaxID=59799 RepID=A0A7G2CPI9_9TRYP|nr:Protein kinase domain/Protein tyrosine kinase/Fungal protein kinase, putative [Angomonas deanei]
MKVTDIVRGKNSTYQLQELLGKGGNAVVYRGVSMNTNTPVAIKKMVANDEVIIKQWRTEVDALIALRADKNDLVVQYLDHMNSGKNLLLVEEYAPGGTLQQLVRGTNGVKEPQVVTCLYRVTRGLEYIHSKNIVHRDLKGANVLLFDNNVVKLADFGLATPSPVTSVEGEDPSEDTENALLGSVYWMAPEVAKGEKHSFSSDIWALGCLCVELLTGNPPLFDRTPVNALYQLAEGKGIPHSRGARRLLRVPGVPDELSCEGSSPATLRRGADEAPLVL